MTMTSAMKRKQTSLSRFFANNAQAAPPQNQEITATDLLRASKASNKARLKLPKKPSPQSSLASIRSARNVLLSDALQVTDEEVKNVKVQKKYKSIYLMVNNKPGGKILVEEEAAEDATQRIAKSVPKKKVAKKEAVVPLEEVKVIAPPYVPPPPKPSKTPPPPTPVEELGRKEMLVNKLQETAAKLAQPHKKGVRTFRLWRPNEKNRSILVRIGGSGGVDEGEQVFDLTNIKQKSFEAWRKEAKLQLPSVTGGGPIEHLEDVIHIAPAVQKENDPIVVQNTLRRLSVGTGAGSDLSDQEREKLKKRATQAAKKKTVTVAAVQPEVRKFSEETEEDESSEEEESEEDSEFEDEDSEDEEDQKREERRQAGVDIKGKLQTLRELSEHLSDKRKIRQQIVEKATGNTMMDPEDVPLKEHLLYIGEYIHDYIHDLFTCFDFWSSSIVEINGRFGVVVASYFMWLRRLVILNVLAFLSTFLLILLPQVIDDISNRTDYRHNASSIYHEFSPLDLLHGEGSLTQSYLFYSGYHGRRKKESFFHNAAFRFLFAMLINFLIDCYFIFSRINTFYQGVRMESKISGFAHNQHFTSIVCGWDFSCADTDAATFLRKSLQRELRILATSVDKREQELNKITHRNKTVLAFFVKLFGLSMGTAMMHIVSNLLLVVCYVTLGWGLHSLCQIKEDYYLDCVLERDDGMPRIPMPKGNWLCPNHDMAWQPWIMSLPAFYASAATLGLNMVIVLVGDIESWDTVERRVYATMLRAGLFYVTNVTVLYQFWISHENELTHEGFVVETIFGKELYRMVIMKGLIDVTLNLGLKQLYDCIRRRSANYKRREFRSEYFALSLFFHHCVAGIGTLFCPGLALFVCLRLILDFYQNRYILLNLSSSEVYYSHASTVAGPYLIAFFATFLLTAFMNMYYMAQAKPSHFDGPFQGYQQYHDAWNDVISHQYGLSWFRHLTSNGFLVGVLALLIALVYFCRQWAKAYEPIISQLNDQIFLERSDRDTLLKAIFEIGRATESMKPLRSIQEEIPQRWTKSVAKNEAKRKTSATGLGVKILGQPRYDVTSSSAVTSTEVSDAGGPDAKRKFVSGPKGASDEAKEKEKHEQKEMKRLLKEVQGDPENKTMQGLQKIRPAGVTVDTWNAQRHRREQMERVVRGIIGARRNIREGQNQGASLSYDPTSKIFAKQSSLASSSGGSSNGSAKSPKRTKVKSIGDALQRLIKKTTSVAPAPQDKRNTPPLPMLGDKRNSPPMPSKSTPSQVTSQIPQGQQPTLKKKAP